MSMFTKYEQYSIAIFKNKEAQNFLACILCATLQTFWFPSAYTSNDNHVIIIELNTSPNGPLRSSFSGAMFGVASTKEIGTKTLKTTYNQQVN